MEDGRTDARELGVGSILGGRYQVIRRLSQGGMGVVYQARHIILDSLVAVKILLKPEAEEASKRFLQEAKLASKIQHPNTIYISDYGVLGENDGRPYLVMEYLEGETLASVIAKGALSPLRACKIAVQLSRGLQAVHGTGIVHRDLKPDNIFLLDKEGSADFVKIVDFGIARALYAETSPEKLLSTPQNPSQAVFATPSKPNLRLTQPGLIVGTPHYMSPEQALGQEVDARSDQYALGCILYEMLTGQVPFDHPHSLGAVMLQHVTESPRPLSELAPKGGAEISENLRGIVAKLLAKDRTLRYSMMREVEAALAKEIDLIEAPAKRTTEKRLPAKKPILPYVMPILLLLVCAVVLGVRFFHKRQKPPFTSKELLALRQEALQILTSDVERGERPLRTVALSALGESRDLALTKVIEPRLLDEKEDEAVRSQAAESLGTLGGKEALATLSSAWKQVEASKTRTLAVSVAGALAQVGAEGGQTLLKTILTSEAEDLSARTKAAYLLCDKGDKEALDLLAKIALAQGSAISEEVTANLLFRLAECGNEDARKRLLLLLDSAKRTEQRLLYAARLHQLGDAKGREFLQKTAARKSPEQLLAARLLSSVEEPQLAPLFRSVLTESAATPSARQLSIEGLGLLGKREDAALLSSFLKGDGKTLQGASLRQAAAVSILRIALLDPAIVSADGLRFAQGALADSDFTLRVSAALTLGELDDAGAVTLLSQLLRDADEKVRKSASKALGSRRERAAMAALKEALSDLNEEVRSESLRSMAKVAAHLSRSGDKEMVREVDRWLRQRMAQKGDKGDPKERLLSMALLLRLGDPSQRAALLQYEKDQDPALRSLLMEQMDGGEEVVEKGLQDGDLAVRFSAARRILAASGANLKAELKSKVIAVLEEVLANKKPGQDLDEAALLAYGLLAKLGKAPSQRHDLALAVRDPSPSVRRAALGTLATLAETGDADPALVRRLRNDPDPGIRARAAALWAKMPAKPEAKPEPKNQTPDLGSAPDLAPVATEPPATPKPEPGPEPAPLGTDKSKDPKEAEILGLAQAGGDALLRKDLRKSQKLLERALNLCARDKRYAKACAGVADRLLFSLGQTFQAQDRLAEAMTEYERAEKSSKGRSPYKERAKTEMARLRPSLGQVVLPKMIKKRCQEVTVWMPPGKHQVILPGKKIHVVEVQAEKVAKAGSCEP